MSREAERAIEWDCAEVLTRFFNYFDQWRYEDMADLFAAGGVGTARARRWLARRRFSPRLRSVPPRSGCGTW
jgi:hypothetical protein